MVTEVFKTWFKYYYIYCISSYCDIILTSFNSLALFLQHFSKSVTT